MTIKFSIPYQQWMQYGGNECRECRKNEYGDIYFVMDISFLLIIRRFKHPTASFSYIVDIMKEHDEGESGSGDISLYFDFESRRLFHDRELKDRAIILYLMPTFIYSEVRDRISLFPNTMALAPNIFFMGHCGTNGHIAYLGKIKRIVEFLVIEKKHKEGVNVMPDVQVKDDCSVFFATYPLHTPIVTFC